MSAALQLDLFGEVEAAESAAATAAAKAAADLAAWRARFDRATWTPPEGVLLPPEQGWVCPDPECRRIERNAFLLNINHGWNPDAPGWAPFDGHCQRLRLLAHQKAHAARQEAAQ